MTEQTDTAKLHTDTSKSSKRERLRDTLRRQTDKLKKSDHDEHSREFRLAEDVQEFLHPKGAASTTASTIAPHQKPIPVPRIDVTRSSRWPTAREVVRQTSPDRLMPGARLSRTQSEGVVERRRRRSDLQVKFDDASPIVIGEGGDDAEAPTTQISMARFRTKSATGERSKKSDGPPPRSDSQQSAFGGSAHVDGDQSMRSDQLSNQFRLDRGSTGVAEAQTMAEAQALELALTLAPVLPDRAEKSRIDPFDRPRPSMREPRLQMQAEEGRSLRESFRDPSLEGSMG